MNGGRQGADLMKAALALLKTRILPQIVTDHCPLNPFGHACVALLVSIRDIDLVKIACVVSQHWRLGGDAGLGQSTCPDPFRVKAGQGVIARAMQAKNVRGAVIAIGYTKRHVFGDHHKLRP